MSKFESLFNRLFFKLLKRLSSFVQKYTPSKLKIICKRLLSFSHDKKIILIHFFKAQIVLAKVAPSKIRLQLKKGDFLNQGKVIIGRFFSDIKSLNGAKIKKSTFKVFQLINSKLKKMIISLRAKPLGSIVASCILILISSFFIFKQTNQLMLKSGLRSPASNPQLPQAVRPNYYKNDEKQLTILNVIMPIIIEDVKSMKSVKLDITIQATNRTSILFLQKRSDILMDYLHTKIEPIVPQFPLTQEGKDIILERIKMKINALLEEHKMHGRINHVYIGNILGG